MKKQFAFLVAFVTALCLISCGESSDTLSTSTAKKVFEKESTRLNRLEGTAQIPTGYFECNDDDVRFKLRQLAANGIVNYSCEKVEKIEKVRKSRRVQRGGYFYSYWDTEYYYANETVETYFVSVTLTEKGKELVIEEKEIEPTEDEAELKNDEDFDWNQFPEASVDYQEFQQEVMMKNQELTKEPEPEVDSIAVIDEDYTDEEQPAEEVKETKPTKELSAYEKAKAKEEVEMVTLKAYGLNIVKARNIEKTGDYTATCEFVLEYENVTPVGRIYHSVHDGQRFLVENITFKYLLDKGWIMK